MRLTLAFRQSSSRININYGLIMLLLCLMLPQGTPSAQTPHPVINTFLPHRSTPSENLAEKADAPLEKIWRSLAPESTTSVAWGDMDGDGDLDLAVGNSLHRTAVYRNCTRHQENDGCTAEDTLFYSNPIWVTLPFNGLPVSDLAWGDVDGDGDLDLAVGGGDIEDPGHYTKLYRNCTQRQLNDGCDRFSSTFSRLAAWSASEIDTASSLAWGDVDGDRDLDLVVGNYERNRLYRNCTQRQLGDSCTSGDSLLSAMAVWTSPEIAHTTSVAWGDMDGDGDLDLAVGKANRSSQVYLNDGTTLNSTAVWSSAETSYATSVAWGDMDGDDDLDLVIGDRDAPNRIYRNDGAMLSPAAVWSSAETSETRSVAWGDVDADGDLDLMAGNSGPNRLYRNCTQRQQGDGCTAGDTFLSVMAVWTSMESESTSSIAWGDADGDGDLDLAVGNFYSYNRVYRNNGNALSSTATWAPPETIPTMSIAWGDVDGDGDIDLAVGNNNAPSQVYRNNGNGLNPTPAWVSTEAGATRSLAWGDVDNDGDLDLVIGNNGHDWLYRNCTQRQSGDGCGVNDGLLSATSVWTSAELAYTTSIAWGDVDGDGDLDLVSGSLGGPIRLYHNEGGVLSATAGWTAGYGTSDTRTIAWGDIDGDGDLDLAAGRWFQTGSIYLNDGGTLSLIGLIKSEPTQSIAWMSSGIHKDWLV
jgi:hypothetical protein